MEFGLFLQPGHPPERPFKAGVEWDLRMLRWADELGFSEAWVGEHHNAPWEPNGAPDLLIAQALQQTKRIRLGVGGYLLPYYHPAALATRVAVLDQMSEGRINFGIAASAIPTDLAMFHVDSASGQNREMTRESLDIILRLWNDPPPFTIRGKYWTVTKPDTMYESLRTHMKPVQLPHPPIGVTGLSKNSDTLKLAGERGFLPMSLNLNTGYVASHWKAVEIGAARAGRVPNRRDWRMVREVFVADTDEEAWRLSVGGMMGYVMREYFLPLYGKFNFLEYFKHDPELPDSAVTAEYCGKHNWIIGSPETVVAKIEEIFHELGGFGTLLVQTFDYSENSEVWHNSFQLLMNEVRPKVAHLTAN
jgi:alkanesulfonate monooxygenase SsuD/methylene tetrahydromethanopterin reductase-like flavin-dependent oxidoreductase (luciferase family)